MNPRIQDSGRGVTLDGSGERREHKDMVAPGSFSECLLSSGKVPDKFQRSIPAGSSCLHGDTGGLWVTLQDPAAPVTRDLEVTLC